MILQMMINIVDLARTPPPIVPAVLLPPAPLYSQDTSPKHSIICLYHTTPHHPIKYPSNASIPKLLFSLNIRGQDMKQILKQIVEDVLSRVMLVAVAPWARPTWGNRPERQYPPPPPPTSTTKAATTYCTTEHSGHNKTYSRLLIYVYMISIHNQQY